MYLKNQFEESEIRIRKLYITYSLMPLNAGVKLADMRFP